MSTSAGSAGTPKDRDRSNEDSKDDDAGRADKRHNRDSLLEREKEQFGGMKFGSGFFGWLTATGTLVLLLALAAVIAALVGSSMGGVGEAMSAAQSDVGAAGIWGAIILLVIWFIAYYCGGYVAGRMARFNGVKQGLAVWIWAIIIAVIIAIVGAIAGPSILDSVGGLPNISVDPGQATLGSVISLVALAVVMLIGAILGGLAGMHFHRKVDKAALSDHADS